MSTITATELELLTFFEVEPIKLDPKALWAHDDSCYEVNVGSLFFSCSIAPADKDVRIILKQGKSRLYEMNAMGIEDIRYYKKDDRECLQFLIGPNETLWLWIKPSIELRHEVRESISE